MYNGKRVLFASDLDKTLIHSYKVAEPGDICVENDGQKPLSYMSAASHAKLQEIQDACTFAAITTRSLAQYRRLRLFRKHPPQYAIVANGAHLIVGGQADPHWFEDTKRLIRPAMQEMERGMNLLLSDCDRCFEARLVDDAFLFTKSNDIEKSMSALKTRLDLQKVRVLNHGEKLYIIPSALHKGAALKRLTRILPASYVVCAGDSEFDLPMLAEADLAFVPNEEMRRGLPKEKNVMVYAPAPRYRFADYITETIRSMLNARADTVR